MQRIIIYLIFILSFVFTSDKPYVLMVSFDGFRYDYMDWANTPNFDYIQEVGTKADGLISVFPSLTFPNHYSIATGAYAGTHNITGNTFYDKNLKKKYSLYDKKSVRNPQFYKSEPIWVTAERQGIKTASFFWVGTEAPIKGISPSIFKYYDGQVDFKTRIDSVISWFQLKENKRPQLILLYFSEPDHSGHEYGINRRKIIESVIKMDSLLGYLNQELQNLEIYNQLNMVITSDHGMVDVSSERLIILDEYISRLDDLYINGKGSHVQFDHKRGKIDYSGILLNELQKIPHSTVWTKTQIPERFHFVNQNTGDYLMLADEGWFITTQSDYNRKGFTLRGMHGYDPKLKNMQGIFYVMGPQIISGVNLDAFENIHIYPFICKLLQIDPYSNLDDGPDGNIKVLEHIINKR